VLELAIDEQSCIKIHFSIEAYGPASSQDEIVGPQYDIIYLDAFIADGYVEFRVAQLE
jgi:hypothetical protein